MNSIEVTPMLSDLASGPWPRAHANEQRAPSGMAGLFALIILFTSIIDVGEAKDSPSDRPCGLIPLNAGFTDFDAYEGGFQISEGSLGNLRRPIGGLPQEGSRARQHAGEDDEPRGEKRDGIVNRPLRNGREPLPEGFALFTLILGAISFVLTWFVWLGIFRWNGKLSRVVGRD